MKNKTTRPTPVEITLLVLAALSAVLLLTMTLLCLPYFNQDPESPHLQQVSPRRMPLRKRNLPKKPSPRCPLRNPTPTAGLTSSTTIRISWSAPMAPV